MPDPDRLLHTIDEAVRAFAGTPGRRGRTVSLLDAKEVLAAGDLHGNLANFKLLLEKAQLASSPSRHLVLQEVVHGPFRYPGGGDKSHQLLDLLAALKCQYPNQVHLLLGNHELAQWTNQIVSKTEADLNALFVQGVEAAYGGRATDVYAAYLRLFAAAPLALRTSNGIFLSHSLPSSKRLVSFEPAMLENDAVASEESQAGEAIRALVWGRDTSLANATAFLDKVGADLLITGHIPCPEGFRVPNERQLILDSSGAPAGYCLFPTDRVLSHQELVSCVGIL